MYGNKWGEVNGDRLIFWRNAIWVIITWFHKRENKLKNRNKLKIEVKELK